MGKSLATNVASGHWRAPAWLAEAGGALASIVLPAGCRLCEQLLTGASWLSVCEDCLASFPRIQRSVCRECGLPIDSASGDEDSDGDGSGELFEDVCLGSRSEKFHFDRARSFARYQGSLVRAIVLLKFEEMEPLADWFADRLAEVVRQNDKALAADLIVPVPLHKIRRRQRGFNQAEVLSKRLAKQLGLPHQGVLLVRKRPRPDKHLLTSNERWEAVRGAFATRPGSQVDKRRVLLVDDVMTTGATLDACAKALREAGASSVLGLTVARAILNPQKVSR
jgi:ComF family protein